MSMALRTPRRRFSPRAKRRYYHIKNFLKKTLGNSSQEGSSRDKQSIFLDDKQCQDLPCLRDVSAEEEDYEESRKSKRSKDKSVCERGDESGASARYHSDYYEGDATRYLHKNTKFKSESYSIPYKEKKKKRSKQTARYDPYDDEQPLYDMASPYLTSSCHSAQHKAAHVHLTKSGYSDLRYEKEYKKHRDLYERQSKDKRSKNKHDRHKTEYERYEEEPKRHRKGNSILDHDFIDDIIRRQYQHVTMFNSQGTVMSQISAPVCRDREFAIQESIMESHDLCSCMFEQAHRGRSKGDQRSICDARLYSSHKKKHSRSKHRHKDKKHDDKYDNDLSLDLVPVKEKSSPKARRKIDIDSIEVPPSPRTNRPRLNLQSQYRDEEDEDDVTPSDSPRREQCRRDQFLADQYEHNLRQMELRKSYKSPERYQNDYLPSHDLHSFVDQSQNVQIEQIDPHANSVPPPAQNNTDEALTEIKDILQTFLYEIKKDVQAPHSEEAQTSETIGKDKIPEAKIEPPKVVESIPVQVPCPTVTAAPAPFPAVTSQGPSTSFQPFGFNKNTPYQLASQYNPPCFPMMPMCQPTPYLLPSSGYTFPCVTSLHRTQSREEHKTERVSDSSKEKVQTSNTDELLKQIYKIVAQNPTGTEAKGTEVKKECRVVEEQRRNLSDSGSNGNAASVNGEKDDKQSLEAIFTHGPGPDGSFESHQERLSVAATRTDSNLFVDSFTMKKRKSGIFGKIIQSIGVFGLRLFKSRSTIEERSECGRHQQRKQKERSRSPWAMRRDAIKREFEDLRRQKRYRSPSPRHALPPRTPRAYTTPRPAPPPFHPALHPHAHPTGYEYPPYPVPLPDQPPPSMYPPPPPMIYEQPRPPTDPPYFDMQQQYHMHQQQAPFCLKEVEVKSIGTQSQVKLNIFKKFKNKKAMSPRPKWMPDHMNMETEQPQYNKEFLKMQKAMQMQQKQMQMQQKQMQMQKQMKMQQKMQMKSEESTPREKNIKPFNFLENEFLKTREKVARDSEIQGDFVKTFFGKPLARGANKGPSWLKSIFEKPNFDCSKPGIKF